jgi:hypothetical protein
MIVMAFIFLLMLIPPLLVVLTIGFLLRRMGPAIRTPLLVAASVLLLTPSLGPATIAVVPAPFGYLLIPTAINGSWPDLAKWVMTYPLWHAISFPVTAVVSYAIIRFVCPNQSFKADGSAAA